MAFIPCRTGLSILAIAAACSVANAQDHAVPASAPVDAIVVTARKLDVETLIDRKVYTVTSDVQSTFGTLSDVLGSIPSVDVDPDGIVALRGDSNVLILIDGKPSTQFSGASAGDNLQSIPAKDIERIEILTTPPPQFKADGAAGVINIITRKKSAEGLSGSVQGSLGNGGRSTAGADGSYHSGPLSVSSTASFRHDYRQRVIQSDLTTPAASTGPLIDSSTLDERIRRSVPTLGLSTDYTLNDRQSLSGSVKWGERGGLRTYTQLNDSGNSAGVLQSSSRRLSAGHDPESDLDLRTGYTQKLARPGETLDLLLHRSTSRQHEHYDYTNEPLIPASATFYDNLNFQEAHATGEVDANYVLPFSKTRTLKAGYAFEQDDYRFQNAGNTFDPVTGAAVIDPMLTNDFKFRQQIHATYASYQALAGAWNWLGGLRAELTRTDALQLTDHLSTTGSYFQLYPSLHADCSLSDRSTLSFGASRRVTRPDPDNLNPYVDHEYAPNLRAGNPGLRPQYTRSFELGYAFEGHGSSFGATGYYRLNRDSATDVTEVLAGGLTLTTKTNLPKNDSAGLELTATGHLLPKLSYNVSGNLFHNQIDATALGISGLQSTTGLNAKVKLDYRPTGNDSAQVTMTRTDKRLTPQGHVSAIDIVNLGYKHQLSADFTAVLTVSDLFSGQRYERLSSSPTFTQDYRRTVVGRVTYLGLVYAFGTAKKDKPANFEYDSSN